MLRVADPRLVCARGALQGKTSKKASTTTRPASAVEERSRRGTTAANCASAATSSGTCGRAATPTSTACQARRRRAGARCAMRSAEGPTKRRLRTCATRFAPHTATAKHTAYLRLPQHVAPIVALFTKLFTKLNAVCISCYALALVLGRVRRSSVVRSHVGAM